MGERHACDETERPSRESRRCRRVAAAFQMSAEKQEAREGLREPLVKAPGNPRAPLFDRKLLIGRFNVLVSHAARRPAKTQDKGATCLRRRRVCVISMRVRPDVCCRLIGLGPGVRAAQGGGGAKEHLCAHTNHNTRQTQSSSPQFPDSRESRPSVGSRLSRQEISAFTSSRCVGPLLRHRTTGALRRDSRC